MINVDFSFFHFLKTRINGSFEVFLQQLLSERSATYMQDLNILFNSQNLLNSKYCSEEFRDEANSYFKENKDSFTKIVVVDSYFCSFSMCDAFLLNLAFDHYDNQAGIEDKLNEMSKGDGLFHYVSGSNSIILDMSYARDTIDSYLKIQNLKEFRDFVDYYNQCLIDKDGTDDTSFIIDILGLFSMMPSYLAIEQTLISTPPSEEYNLIEGLTNRTWFDDDVIDELTKISKDQMDFWVKLVKEKGFEGFRLFVSSLPSQKSMADFFNSNADFMNMNQDDAFNVITQTLFEEDYASVDMQHLKNFDVVQLKNLARKYQMPSDFLRKLVSNNLKINPQDNVRGYFNDFKISVAYKKNGKQTNKQYKVELLKKNDPTALFFGKMTDCCQFYTGDSSNEAVMPVYSDPNAGLIVIKDRRKVKAGSFVWLTNDGMVLDSFEHQEEARKALPDFLIGLSKQLSDVGKTLYLGSGGGTVVSLDQEVVDRPKPLTEDYIPYEDSIRVYKIDSENIVIKKHFNCKEAISALTDAERGVIDHIGDILNDQGLLNILLEHVLQMKDYDLQIVSEFLNILGDHSTNLIHMQDQDHYCFFDLLSVIFLNQDYRDDAKKIANLMLTLKLHEQLEFFKNPMTSLQMIYEKYKNISDFAIAHDVFGEDFVRSLKLYILLPNLTDEEKQKIQIHKCLHSLLRWSTVDVDAIKKIMNEVPEDILNKLDKLDLNSYTTENFLKSVEIIDGLDSVFRENFTLTIKSCKAKGIIECLRGMTKDEALTIAKNYDNIDSLYDNIDSLKDAVEKIRADKFADTNNNAIIDTDNGVIESDLQHQDLEVVGQDGCCTVC